MPDLLGCGGREEATTEDLTQRAHGSFLLRLMEWRDANQA